MQNNQIALSTEELEGKLLQLPQAQCPVQHLFGDGIYIREVSMPADALVIGHHQKTRHLNVFIAGKVAMSDGKGGVKILEAPMTFTAEPGRKVGYVLEAVVWQNIYATDETDIDTLETTYLDKSPTWQAHETELAACKAAAREPDVADYNLLLTELGVDDAYIREQSENTTDLIDSDDNAWISIRESTIEGKGVFATTPKAAGQCIGAARIGNWRTSIGRYTNHSPHPNAEMRANACGGIDMFALRDIVGCLGGSAGEEITVNYRDVLALSVKPTLEKVTCQV